MKKDERVVIQLSEIEDIIFNAIRKKYKLDDSVKFHRMSNTYFLMYSVIRDGDMSGCKCITCKENTEILK